MSARDATTRLARRLREAERPTAFRPGFDASHITIAPDSARQPLCENFPECGCDLDCADGPRLLTHEQRVLLVVLSAIVIAVLGLLIVALRT